METGLANTESVTYGTENLGKAIHLFRHPLDNVVARFHSSYKKSEANFKEKYPYNSTGFNNWCAAQDKKRDLFKYHLIDDALASKLTAVKCYNEFFKYLQWHNLAFETTRSLSLPTLIMHYEDYSNEFDTSVKRLVAFLELPSTGSVVPFLHGKVYRDYYSLEQRIAIRDLVTEMASAETWHYMKDYDFS